MGGQLLVYEICVTYKQHVRLWSRQTCALVIAAHDFGLRPYWVYKSL